MMIHKSLRTLRPHINVVKRSVKSLEDDGVHSNPSLLDSMIRKFRGTPPPGTLILVRHGKLFTTYASTLLLMKSMNVGECFNNTDRKFTGWIDSDLSPNGVREIEHSARLLLERGHTIDITYTSVMKRAIRSAWIILKELDQVYRPTIKSWRLNERMYGALEGLSKPELAALVGEERVQLWRAGLEDRPPPMNESHEHWHGNERKYKYVESNMIPRTESLEDALERVKPLWESDILPDLKLGRNVMVVAHTNSLRGIIRIIDKLDIKTIQKVGIPNGIPLVYKFDHEMKPIIQRKAVAPLSGEYLEKRGLLREALARQEELAQKIEGYKDELHKLEQSSTLSHSQASTAVQATVKSLTKLEEQRKLLNQLILESGGTNINKDDDTLENTDNLSDTTTKNNENTEELLSTTFSDCTSQTIVTPPKKIDPIIEPIQFSSDKNTHKTHIGGTTTNIDYQEIPSPLLVIIRHGKTEHNKLGLFTGWEDASLAEEGRKEAKKAGILLQRHGVQFDIVYTSWLSRAIETAWMVTEELDDSLWLPVVKSWRLNERMYGALTGLSKKMIKQRHGNDQFTKWRHPGNDERYVTYVQDIEYSMFETIIRSLAHGKLELHRNFPKAESLKDCMDRTIPYFKNVILPNSIHQNKNVLVASSENAIRGLLMHLCQISPNQIHQVEIPTGLPLIFDPRINRIRLLEDETDSHSPFTKHNFGAPDLLFRPEFMSTDEFQALVQESTGSQYSSPHEERERFMTEYDPIIRLKK